VDKFKLCVDSHDFVMGDQSNRFDLHSLFSFAESTHFGSGFRFCPSFRGRGFGLCVCLYPKTLRADLFGRGLPRITEGNLANGKNDLHVHDRGRGGRSIHGSCLGFVRLGMRQGR